jgi:PTH1 family peptidyl-tRNA hydrolase
MRLVVGLGNPGAKYTSTRHNIGYRVVEAMAGNTLREERRFRGALSKTEVNGETVLFLQPRTYMNASGESVRLVCDYFKIDLKDVLVVVDDVALPLGKQRLRAFGGAGGHNGLKSIKQHMRSQEYARLRVGVGAAQEKALVDHVLGVFTAAEKEKVENAIRESCEVIEQWIQAVDTESVISWMGIKNNKKQNEEKETIDEQGT